MNTTLQPPVTSILIGAASDGTEKFVDSAIATFQITFCFSDFNVTQSFRQLL
jgi:hypothetical protein